jgi:hypothetical protein
MDPQQVPQYRQKTTQIINQQEMNLSQALQQVETVDSAGQAFY